MKLLPWLSIAFLGCSLLPARQPPKAVPSPSPSPTSTPQITGGAMPTAAPTATPLPVITLEASAPCPAEPQPPPAPCPSVTISTDTTWTASHIRLAAHLVVAPGATLTLRDSEVEIVSRFAREFQFYVQPGGKVISERSRVGGTRDTSGVIQQTQFDMQGSWQAVDTEIRYSYGFQVRNQGELQALRLTGGPNPDSVFLMDEARVSLEESSFMMSLVGDVRAGGTSQLSLPSPRPLTGRYGANAGPGFQLPGARWQLSLRETSVPLWFLFLEHVGESATPANLILGEAPSLVPALLSSQLTGTITLPALSRPDGTSVPSTTPVGTQAQIGNLRLETTHPHTVIGSWGVYLSGALVDVLIRGPTTIAEMILSGGAKVRVEGTADKRETWLACTTLDVVGQSRLLANNVFLGQGLLEGVRGQITARDGGQIQINNAEMVDLTTLIDDASTGWFSNLSGLGKFYPKTARPPWLVRSAIESFTPSPTTRSGESLWAGMAFRIKGSPQYLSTLGRFRLPGNSGSHEMRLLRRSDNALVARAVVDMTQTTPSGFVYSYAENASSPGSLIVLEPNVEYVLLSQESADTWSDGDTTIATGSHLERVTAAWADIALTQIHSGGDGKSYVPVDFQVSESDRVMTAPPVP